MPSTWEVRLTELSKIDDFELETGEQLPRRVTETSLIAMIHRYLIDTSIKYRT
jgi:hypothetical protein